jgi:carboxypeptidase T
MRDLFASHHFTAGITYHSYSELVLFPYGYSSSCLAPDNDALEELAVDMAESIPKITGS